MTRLELVGEITAKGGIVQSEGRTKGEHPVITIMRRGIQYLNTADDGVAKQEVAEVPIISPNSLKKEFREALARDITFKFVEGGKAPFDFNSIYVTYNGGTFVKNKSVNKAYLSLVEQVRQGNLVVGMCGAAMGAVGVPSRLSISHIWPICQETAMAKVLYSGKYDPKTLVPASELIKTTFLTQQNKFVNRLNLLNILSDEGVEQYEKKMGLAKATSENRAEVKKVRRTIAKALAKGEGISEELAEQQNTGNGEDKAAQIQQYQRHEYIVPGTVFSSRIRIDGATSLDAGILLSAFRSFSDHPVLGGMSTRGFGGVDVNYDVYLIGDKGREKVGTIAVSESDIEKPFTYKGDYLSKAAEEFNNFIEGLTIDKILVPAEIF